MTDRNNSERRPDPVGSRSPTSEEAKQQGMSGDRGAQAARTPGTGQQNPQASNRRPAEHEQPPEQRRHFDAENAPSEQGEKDHRSPQVIAQHQQGIGRQSGSHAGQSGDRSEEEAQSGAPRGDHARHGRQDVPGSREQNQKNAD